MTWDELETLRDRLNTVLEYERAEEGFSPIEEDYYIQYRQAARRAVADIDPDHSRDRDHYRTLQEIDDGWFCQHNPPGEIITESRGELIIRCYKRGEVVSW